MRYATPSQRRFVLAAKVRPGDPASNWSLLSRLPAGADPVRFAAAVEAVLHGNDSFNEIFELDASGEIIVTATSIRQSCSVRAYSDIEAVRDRVQALADSAFELSDAPLYHAEVAVVGEESYFLFAGAHVLCDGFGFYNLIGDFAARYADPGYISPSTSSPVDTVEPYGADPAAAQRYYAGEFAGIDNLGIDGWDRRDARGRVAGEILRHTLPGADYRAAGTLAKKLGVRRYSVLLSTYALTVGCLSGLDSVVVSVPMSNRRASAAAQATRGVRVHALPVRFDLSGEATFADLCRAADRQLAHLIEFEQFAFADFSRRLIASDSVDAVQPSVSFTVYPRPLAVVIDDEVGVPVHVDRRFIQYPLSMNIEVGTDSATLIIERADHLPHCDIGELYTQVLRHGVTAADVRLTELRWVTAESAAEVLPETRFPEQTLVEAYRAAAASTPDAVAVIDDSTRLTYRELDRLSDDIASWIVNTLPEHRIGVRLGASARQVATLLGVFKANKIYVPIDPASGPGRYAQVVTGCGGLIVLVDVPDPVEGAREVRLPLEFTAATPLPDPVGTTDLAYLLFTSGTTGTPKGVQVEHASLTRFFDGLRRAIPTGPGRRWLLFHSVAFDVSFAETFGALLSGGTVCVPADAVRRDPHRLAEYIADHEIAVLSQTPSAFTMVSGRLSAARALEYVILCAERLEYSSVAAFVAARPDVRVVNSYGITETTVYHTAFAVPADPADFPAESVIGRPFADVGMAVVDDLLRVVPRGVPGQLVVNGPGLMRGYLGRDDLTAARIMEVDGVPSYLSGDRGYLDDAGQFVITGRIDRQVKIRGHRCELGEIEHAVAATGRVEAVYATVFGAGLTAELVCFIVLAPGTGTIDELRRDVRAALPRYLEPDRYLTRTAMPMTANSKVDAAALTRLYEAETAAAQEITFDGTAGRADIREVVDAIWADVLDGAEFDGSTRFFDAGGTSAMVIQVGERLRARLGVTDIHVVDLFEYCTPESLTGFLVEKV
ncbi:amino acid adenylation domain-containing protein [Nocardia sp. NPDC056100]|uniref:amino acid adenylation domain-containing protein n=1 Tax=Nocardia sp. NPDC056100 TaxID=3345712 RepID=UPI0035E0655A